MSHEIKELVAGYQAGSTAKELGERWGIHRTTVSAILKTEGDGFATGHSIAERSSPRFGSIAPACPWPRSVSSWHEIRAV